MPVLTGDALTRWRTHPQVVEGKCVVWIPDRVASRRVNQASFTYPVSTLAFDNPDGDPGDMGDVEAGLMITFRDGTDGAVKGTSRARSVDGSTLHIHPVGQGDVSFLDDDTIDIYDMYQPYALIPYISPDGTLYKDFDVAYTDQTDAFPPVANANPDRLAGEVDPSTNKLRVTFDALGWLPSFAMDGTISGYLWDIKDGTLVSGTLTDAQITVDFPPGKRWVKLTVMASNGASGIKRVPIWAADDGAAGGGTYAAHKARLARRGYGSHQSGWELSLEFDEPDASTVPEHALVLFWTPKRYGAWKGDVTGVSLAFMGWVTNELLGMEPLWSDVTFNARGPLAILQQRPAFPQTVRRATSPANWAQVKGLDWWKTVVYLLMFHSNVLELCDIERPDYYADLPLKRLDSQAGTLYDQVRFLANAAWGAFTCDAGGRLFLRRNPHLMTGTERWGWTPIVNLTASDLVGESQGPRFERATWDSLAWLRGGAILADPDDINAVLAITPGTLPGQGAAQENVDQRLVQTQIEFNERLGHLYAYRQGRRDGRRVMRRGTLTLAHDGDAVDPAWQEVVTLSMDAASNRRGYAFDTARLVPVGMDVSYDFENGTMLPRLTVEEETRGAAGETVIPSSDTVDDQDPPPYEEPPLIDPPPPDTGDGGPIDWSVADGYAATLTEIRRSRAFAQAGRTWEVVFEAASDVGAGWEVHDFQCSNLDPANHAQVVVTNTTSETRIYGTTNLDDATPTWSLLETFPYKSRRAKLWYSIFPNVVFLMISPDQNTLHVFHTHDTWSTRTDQLDIGGIGLGEHTFFISNQAAGQAKGLVVATYGSGANHPQITRSTNYGGSFSVLVFEFDDFYVPTDVHIPFEGNEAEQILYVLGGTGSTDDAFIQRSTDGGSSWVNISPTYDTYLHGGGLRAELLRKTIYDWTQDSQKLAAILTPSQDRIGADQKVFVSDDGGDTWVHKYTLGSSVRAYYIGGWPYDVNVLYVCCDDRLIVSTDRGDTWEQIQWTGYEDGLVFVPIWK
jgi:hypothetical protein